MRIGGVKAMGDEAPSAGRRTSLAAEQVDLDNAINELLPRLTDRKYRSRHSTSRGPLFHQTKVELALGR
jgi:hypothetical protein